MMFGPVHSFFGGFGMGGGSIMMLLWFTLISAVIYLLVRKNTESVKVINHPAGLEAIEIAKVRLAKGEITIEEFDNLKKVLYK